MANYSSYCVEMIVNNSNSRLCTPCGKPSLILGHPKHQNINYRLIMVRALDKILASINISGHKDAHCTTPILIKYGAWV